MKVGIEVEGRLKGLRTLFLDQSEFPMLEGVIEGLQHSEGRIPHQIYISDLNNKLDLHGIELKHFYVVWFVIVTVERTKLEIRAPKHVNVVLRVDNSSFWFLNDKDQIKFEEDKYVWTFTAESGIATRPEAFLKDVKL